MSDREWPPEWDAHLFDPAKLFGRWGWFHRSVARLAGCTFTRHSAPDAAGAGTAAHDTEEER